MYRVTENMSPFRHHVFFVAVWVPSWAVNQGAISANDLDAESLKIFLTGTKITISRIGNFQPLSYEISCAPFHTLSSCLQVDDAHGIVIIFRGFSWDGTWRTTFTLGQQKINWIHNKDEPEGDWGRSEERTRMRRTIKWEGMRNETVRKGRRERKEERTRREGERIRICKLPSKSNSESFKLLEVLPEHSPVHAEQITRQ